MKVKDLTPGLQDVSIEVTIDYIPDHYKGKDWGVIYVKDETKDIRMILMGKEMQKAKEGMKIKITKGYISTHRGELQLNATNEHPIEFI